MKNTFLSAMLLAAAMFVSCSKDNVGGGQEGGAYDPASPVTFTTLQDDGPEGRGTPITSASQMTDMGVFCSYTGSDDWTAEDTPDKMFNLKMLHSSGAWSYAGAPVYWETDKPTDRYTFFAYAPYGSAANGIAVTTTGSTKGTPKLRYTVPSNVVNQPDLMVAVPRKNLRPTGGAVALSMKHALTCVGFQIAGNGEKIKAITIEGVSLSGTLDMSAAADGTGIVWTDLAAPSTGSFSASLNYDTDKDYYTAESEMSSETDRNLLKGDGYLMMIPQTPGEDAKLVVTLDDNTKRTISLSGTAAWTAGQKLTYAVTLTAQGTITLAPTSVGLFYEANSSGSFEILCKDGQGNEVAGMEWTLKTNASWIEISTDPTGTGRSSSVSGTGSKTIYVFTTTANTSTTTNRTTTVYLNGTPATKVDVTQVKTFTGGNIILSGRAYIGAFWRAGQTGERLIKNQLTNSGDIGAWTARVAWMDENWEDGNIVLDTEPSSDAAIYTGNPGDAEYHQLEGTATSVTGTVALGGNITFRIGLKSKLDGGNEHAAPRYAVVMVSYANNTKHYNIYLRQGEAPDYLMRPEDPSNSGGFVSDTRPLAKKWSVYNLTATILNAQVPVRGGKFVEYPTQGGAFFQWGNNLKPRYAWTPVGSISGWSDDANFASYWNSLKSTHEVSPTGFRRPYDGSITAAEIEGTVADSETRQSLWLHPQSSNTVNSDNSVKGYYADGWFDRRQILSGRLVENNAQIAHIGNLFFNPTTNASLFFPRASFLSNLLGGSFSIDDGYYWTGSAKGGTPWSITFMGNNISMTWNFVRGHGVSIRPVVE